LGRKYASGLPAAIGGAHIAVLARQYRTSRARTVDTEIAQCAWIAIVAEGNHRDAYAPTEPIARIFRTRIFIVAIDGLSNTNTRLTVVPHRTHVSVKALAFIEQFMTAPISPCAGIDRAVVPIVTRILVCQAVAIIIHPIAGLFGWWCRRTS
jgi:hypothetical protein